MIRFFMFIFVTLVIFLNLIIIKRDKDEIETMDAPIFYLRSNPVSRPKRYVMWKKTSAGWGNRLLGMSKAVAFSMVYDAEILMDHDQYEECFDDPEIKKWFIGKRNFNRLSKKSTSLLSKNWNPSVQYTMIPEEGYNEIPEEWLDKLMANGFLETKDQIELFMKIGNMLTRGPSKKLLEAVNEIKQKIGLLQVPSFTLQIRTMKDYGPGHKIAMSHEKQKDIWGCAKKVIGDSNKTIFFTTDEEELFTKVKVKYPNSFYNAHGFQHISHVNDLSPIAEWYIMGESENVACSFTSFCLTAVSRRYDKINSVFSIRNTYKKEPVECVIISHLL